MFQPLFWLRTIFPRVSLALHVWRSNNKTWVIDCRYGFTWRDVACAHIYNFLFRSLIFSLKIVIGVKESGYNLMCADVKVSNSKEEMKVCCLNLNAIFSFIVKTYFFSPKKVTNALWLYFFSKAIEFLDTFWMVIRKRFNQYWFCHHFLG